jgi:hypothetical protein
MTLPDGEVNDAGFAGAGWLLACPSAETALVAATAPPAELSTMKFRRVMPPSSF